MTLWEGARRLPYFFSYGTSTQKRAVLCPQCVLEQIEREPERIHVHYSINRSVMCGRCGILIGPISEEEMEEA